MYEEEPADEVKLPKGHAKMIEDHHKRIGKMEAHLKKHLDFDPEGDKKKPERKRH